MCAAHQTYSEHLCGGQGNPSQGQTVTFLLYRIVKTTEFPGRFPFSTFLNQN